jgi:hypothetical protein
VIARRGHKRVVERRRGGPHQWQTPRIRTYDLWVMRRMAPVPRLPSDPAASHLARADRPWRPTSSSQPDCCPQRPYYRFYYGRPRIIADNSARLPVPTEDLALGAAW